MYLEILNSIQLQEQGSVISPKRTKVLLIVLGFALVFAFGLLCTLGILYNNKLGDFESLNEKHIMVSKQLSVHAINSTIMKKEFKDLTARYNTLREWLSFYDAQSCNLSVDGWIACRGKLYLFNSDKLNWSSSRDVCVSKGADLVTITNQTEQDFVTSKVKETHWIGLNDLDTEGHWLWVNNQPLNSLEFWMKRNDEISEPDNWTKVHPDGEDCASLGHPTGNTDFWTDAYCFEEKRFVCEAVAAI
ncbi:lectin BRA-3-like [Garra rufa]|uniref:lectin BRA-3-like n=1 Tax=Garra rufa TaxID=137080 RepID=UPI003CCE76EF